MAAGPRCPFGQRPLPADLRPRPLTTKPTERLIYVMGPALAQARPPRVAEKTQIKQPALRVVDARPTAAISDPGMLLYLQRTAGNAAVASLIESRRRPPVVQRCAGGACACSPEEREAHDTEGAPVPVQRSFLDTIADAAGSLLPDSIKSVISGSPAKANATAGQVQEHAATLTQETHTQGAGALEQSTASADAVATEGRQQMGAHTEHAEAISNDGLKHVTTETTKSESATSALGVLGSLAPAIINPVGPILALPQYESAIEHTGSVLAAIPGGAADLGSGLKAAVNNGLKSGHNQGWDCDQAQIMKIVGGVDEAIVSSLVKAGKKVFGDERYEMLAGWAHARIADLKEVATAVRANFELAKKGVADFWKANVAPVLKKVQGVMDELGKAKDKVVEWAGKQWDHAKQIADTAWKAIKTNVIGPAVAFAHTAKETVTKLVTDAKAAIGSWWDKLPKFAQAAIMGMGAAIVGPVGLALVGAERAGEALAGLADKLGKRIKALSDGLLQVIAKEYQAIRKKVVDGVGKFKHAWAAIKTKAHQFLAAAGGKIDGATGGKISSLLAALASIKGEISGAVCTAVGKVTGPCIDQWVPNPGKGEEADVTLTSNAEVTVPVYDVPVKIGKGASIKIERKDKTKYTVTESGEGLLAVAMPKAGGEGGGGGSMSLDVSGPLGSGASWKTLTGKDAAAATTPAAGGSSAGPADATKGEGGGGPEVEAEAGYKGSIEMAYGFDAADKSDKKCNGLGGLTAFLGAQGLSQVLPAPFSAVASAAAEGSYAENLTSCIVALLQYGKASVNLKQDGKAGVEAAIKGESKVALEHSKKDDAEGWIDTAKLSQSLGVSAAAKLATGGSLPLNLSGEAGVTGTMFANLKYAEKTGVITALGAGAKAVLSLDLDPGKIQSVLPSSVAGTVLAQVTPYLKFADPGSLEVEASWEVTDLQKGISAVDDYLNKTPPGSVTTDGLFKVVADYMATANVKQELTVKLKTTHSLAKAAASLDAKEAGGKISLELLEHHTKILYKSGEGGSE